MKSQKHGTSTSAPEVTHISAHGLWILVRGSEYFLSYEAYPWFRTATIAQVLNVRQLHQHHLHWPDLDVDLELDGLNCPESYPLVYN
ncbi:MAG TPA: DUF2442 domain-containing protein [Kiritimatiellia bacterium]|nr:DUF2442 domain-containing protein [Kiritimatiellia bacterium]